MARARQLMFLGLLFVVVAWPWVGTGQTGAKNGQWPAYSADEASTRYSPLDQITRDNVRIWKWPGRSSSTDDIRAFSRLTDDPLCAPGPGAHAYWGRVTG